jgi:hypothetical protein
MGAMQSALAKSPETAVFRQFPDWESEASTSERSPTGDNARSAEEAKSGRAVARGGMGQRQRRDIVRLKVYVVGEVQVLFRHALSGL